MTGTSTRLGLKIPRSLTTIPHLIPPQQRPLPLSFHSYPYLELVIGRVELQAMHERVKQLRSLLDQRRALLLLAFFLAHLVTHLPLRLADLSQKNHRGGALGSEEELWRLGKGVGRETREQKGIFYSLSPSTPPKTHEKKINKHKKTFPCLPRGTASHISRRGKLNQSIMLSPILHKIQLSFFYISSRVFFVKSDAHTSSSASEH